MTLQPAYPSAPLGLPIFAGGTFVCINGCVCVALLFTADVAYFVNNIAYKRQYHLQAGHMLRPVYHNKSM